MKHVSRVGISSGGVALVQELVVDERGEEASFATRNTFPYASKVPNI